MANLDFDFEVCYHYFSVTTGRIGMKVCEHYPWLYLSHFDPEFSMINCYFSVTTEVTFMKCLYGKTFDVGCQDPSDILSPFSLRCTLLSYMYSVRHFRRPLQEVLTSINDPD